ncbi:MAG TPA: SRPBCC family protein [Casimicrobiaceae bacterium]
MKVRLERTFPMPASPEVTWAALTDIEAVAACVPGAKVTERIDDTHYKGTATIKIGPATLAFRGDIEVLQLDAAKRTLQLVAKGTDASGSSAASLDLTARIEAAGEGSSVLVGTSESTVSGKAAVFGGRMMEGAAEQIMKQFAANFTARVEAIRPAGAAAASDTASTSAPAPQALNGLAFLWAVLKDWLRGLFTKKAA